jgi:hypothetical protein
MNFPDNPLDVLYGVLNRYDRNVTEILSVAEYPEYLTLSAQLSDRTAIVVHLMADGDGTTTVVGDPSRDDRVAMANLLVTVAQVWGHTGFPREGALRAASECYA